MSHPIPRAFIGTANLYGDIAPLLTGHVQVIGLGGVGSWCAEALVRSGVGELTLVDMDVVSAGNINRQLVALESTLGESKIEVLKARLYDINPSLKLHLIDDFITADNVNALLKTAAITLDCTDDMDAKVAMALWARFNKTRFVTCGGAGGKTDPSNITTSDLKDAYQDPLLARLRNRLRRAGINRNQKEKYRIPCVYSTQQVAGKKGAGLSCQAMGSSAPVTASFGMQMAHLGIMALMRQGNA